MIIYGENKTVDQILKEVEKDALFYARSGGGMTLSGGEPLMHADIALPLLREARHRRIKTAIETCGCIPWDTLKEALRTSTMFCSTSNRWTAKSTAKASASATS